MKYLLPALLLFPTTAFALQPVSIEGAISLLVYLVVVGLIFWVIWWFVGYVAVPEPFNKVIRVVLGLIALLVIISILLSMIGHPIFR